MSTYKSEIMNAWKVLADKIVGDYNIYSSIMLPKMEFPAIILTPSTQVFSGDLSSYRNFNCEYEWQLIILFRVADYETEYDRMIAAMDEAWLLAETIPNMLGVKILESVPFGHIKDNKEIFAIEFKVKSRK